MSIEVHMRPCLTGYFLPFAAPSCNLCLNASLSDRCAEVCFALCAVCMLATQLLCNAALVQSFVEVSVFMCVCVSELCF